MNVELTIQAMYDDFPCLFKERADCLNQLFCTIGNGYAWYNGELVEDVCGCCYWHPAEISELESHLVDGVAFQHNKLSLRDEAIYYAKERGETVDPSDERFLRLPDDVYHKEPRKARWYFAVKKNVLERRFKRDYDVDFCERFAYLFNYPDDIKPDWKLAIEECRRMIEEDGYFIPNK